MFIKKPPMGWNSWNTFAGNISEELIMQIADAMVETGLHDAGYEYVVIDDCWSLRERDAETGKIVADPARFPHGMKYLGDYIHSKGLKFGMYSCAGTHTCAGFPGSQDNEYIDAQTFADWGVDYLKYDYCNLKKDDVYGPKLYNRMAMALKASGRDILFSACNWGKDETEKWARSSGADIYRSTGDIFENPQSIRDIFVSQIDKISYSMPGCYNDLDMFVVGLEGKGYAGDEGCGIDEYRTHFGLWCLFMSPLMIGCDIRNMSKEKCSDILLDKDFIALDQDEEGRPPFVLIGNGKYAFLRPLANGEYCLAFANLCPPPEFEPAEIYANFEKAGLPANSGYEFEMYDMVAKKNIGRVSGGFGVTLKPLQSAFYRLKLVKKA